MPNILCLDQYSNIGGGQRSLLALLPGFCERGWTPVVAAPGGGPFHRLLHQHGYRTHDLSHGTYSSKKKPPTEFLKYACEMPGVIRQLDQLVTRQEISLMYVNGTRLMPPAAWVAKRRGIPVVFHCHCPLLQRSAAILTGEALRLTNAHVIACCRYAAHPIRRYVRPERLSIVFNGVEEMAAAGRKPQKKIRRIGVVGRVEMGKGQLQFVEAARIILKNASGCTFAIAGAPMFSGEDYYKRVVASSQGLPFEFVDWRDDIAAVYANLDLLVAPSNAWEATTRVILEAYSAGIPVVAFPSGGIPEILQDNETGFLTNGPTAEALAHRVLSVLSMERSAVETVVEKARRKWSECHTVSAYRAGVCDVLSRAAA